MKILHSKIPFIFLFIFALVFTANAQGVPSSIQGLSLTLSTDNPTPGQVLTVTAESYVTDLNSSNITWKLNGSTFKAGNGITSIQVEAPALGKKLAVSVTAITPEGRTMNAGADISSGKIDLIMEHDGYVPPFFRGKLPISYQNEYRITAFPHLANSSGVEYDPKTLVYNWSKDSSVIQDQSGYGKQVFSWKDEIVPRSRTIEVKVSTRDGSAQAEKAIAVEASSPTIIFYRNDPLYGPLYNNDLGNQVGLGKSGELALLAVPLGFNQPFLNNLSFTWMINDQEQTDLSTSQSITLRSPGDTAGSSIIRLQIRNVKDILQGAENAITATFGRTNQAQTDLNSNNYNGL